MDQSQQNQCLENIPRHIGIIMDGNGRWAKRRMLPRSQGHKAGVDALKKTVRAARDFGVEYLTLYSFSSENWSRPEGEINELFSLLRLFIRRDLAELHKNNVCVRVIGARTGLPSDILNLLTEAENLTRENDAQYLVIAFNYGSRDEIVRAMQKMGADIQSGSLDPSEITEDMVDQFLDTKDIPDPDLIIRTSGERRLSNFLMWQASYSELIFADCLWPDFDREQLHECLLEYNNRTRTFGGLVKDTGS